MSSTGKLVVSFEADPPPACYSPELQALEDKIRTVLEAYAQDTLQSASGGNGPADSASAPDSGMGAGNDRTGLIQRGNTFILTTGFGRRSFGFLIEASEGAWLLVYGGLDSEGSVMLELQDGRVVTRRERVPVDTLNDYGVEEEGPRHSSYSQSHAPLNITPGAREEEDSAPPEADDDFPY